MSEPGSSSRGCAPRHYGGYDRSWRPRYYQLQRRIGPGLWVTDRHYLPRQRSMLEVLRIRLRWQMRRWRWEYGL